MSKQPHQMTRDEFSQTFPLFSELSSRAKWRCYFINNKLNLQETGEECSWNEFLEFVKEGFRWDTDDMSLLIDERHEYFVQQALQYRWDIPSDVLAEYPDLIEEHINKRIKQKREQQKRLERRQREKDESKLSKDDKAFWSMF